MTRSRGETLTLSLIVNEPQLVANVTVRSARVERLFGGLRSRLWDLGLGTFGRPLAAVAAVSEPAPGLSTAVSATTIGGASHGQRTA
jgi:hypothetical protein